MSGPPLQGHLRASKCVFVCVQLGEEGLIVKSEVKARERVSEGGGCGKPLPIYSLRFSSLSIP